MKRVGRLALVVFGLTAAVYAAASLTGGWLGTPPWWDQPRPLPLAVSIWIPGTTEAENDAARHRAIEEMRARRDPREGREWISAGVLAVGLGLAALGVWLRRPREVVVPKGALRMALATVVGLGGVMSGSMLLLANGKRPPGHPSIAGPRWWDRLISPTDRWWLWTDLISIGLLGAGALILILLGVAARQRRQGEPAES